MSTPDYMIRNEPSQLLSSNQYVDPNDFARYRNAFIEAIVKHAPEVVETLRDQVYCLLRNDGIKFPVAASDIEVVAARLWDWAKKWNLCNPDSQPRYNNL